ncbi:MAG: GNAT family N-acetyltransferase [Candidatus Lernaella stagnicola]|nr:GNAT family N-acetyltransferase [Candidatus Lernaella stagnicola]
MSDITIRAARRGDAKTLAANNQAMALETENLEIEWDTALAGVNAVLEEPSRGFYLVGIRGLDIIGQLMITYEWSDWRNGDVWWIQSVYIAPEARRTKFFTALYNAVLRRAHRAGNVVGIRLYVDRRNKRAQAAYGKIGMRRSAYWMYESLFEHNVKK